MAQTNLWSRMNEKKKMSETLEAQKNSAMSLEKEPEKKPVVEKEAPKEEVKEPTLIISTVTITENIARTETGKKPTLEVR